MDLMDSQTLLNLGLVLVFVLVGGVFSATEIALVSLRESQLTQLERQGSRGARVAAVARDPNRFLAAVQIGVTVAGFFSAAYGGSTLAPDLAPYLEAVGLGEEPAETAALIVMTLVIAYLSLVLGGWGGGATGISNLDNMSAIENETTGFHEFEQDRWYRIRLRVTDDKVEAWVDDEQIVGVEHTKHKLSIWWEQEPVRPFGIASWYTKSALRNIRLTHL